MAEVKNGDIVRLHYVGRLRDGTQFGSSEGKEPIEFKVGAGQVISGLDREVDGMAVGDRATVKIAAADAYGPRDESQVQVIPREVIPEAIEVRPGVRLQANTREGNQVELTVTEIGEDGVTVDANHPLAGHDLIFDIEVIEVIAA